MPVFSHLETDYRSFRMFTSQLVDLGQCKQVEIVKAFGVSSISVKRHVKTFRAGGIDAFFHKRKSRSSTVFTPDVLNRAQELFDQGASREDVSDTLKLKPDSLYRALKTGRLVEHKKKRFE
jgi:transposase